MLRHRFFPLLLVTALLAVGCSGGLPNTGCQLDKELSGLVETAGATALVVNTGVGSVTIRGDAQATAVTVSGSACASSQALLDEMGLTLEKVGDQIQLTTLTPNRVLTGSLGMKLSIALPQSLALKVQDGSGDLIIERVASLELEDGSGDISVTDVAGDVRIVDGSGDMELSGIGGNVRIHDGSGDIRVRDVRGGVTIVEDGSGDIDVQGVDGDLLVEQDGSGSIWVRDVGGNFTVAQDGSGKIEHVNVGGKVSIPSRK